MSECSTRSADATGREHYGLAICCARRFAGRGVPMEELIGEAEAALLWAASRFDQSRGTRFSTYAIPFVLGALRELCRRAAPMHVPRGEMRLLAVAQRARDEWRAGYGREPTLEELSRAVGVPPERLAAMLTARERMSALSGEEDMRGASSPDDSFEDWVLLRDVIARLDRPYAQVLWLRFGVGFSQSEVAGRLGVSQPQLSRWERRGRELLGAALGKG